MKRKKGPFGFGITQELYDRFCSVADNHKPKLKYNEAATQALEQWIEGGVFMYRGMNRDAHNDLEEILMKGDQDLDINPIKANLARFREAIESRSREKKSKIVPRA